MNGEECEALEKLVYMWGYLPGALPQRTPLLTPVRVPASGSNWKDVSGGGCGFAMAISGIALSFPIYFALFQLVFFILLF
jgi:hypothetical protein